VTDENPRLPIRAAHGTELTARSWQTEAPLRMLMNNLDPEVAERPEDLVVYGGTGKAARSWAAYDAIVRSLRDLEDDETLLVQSGKPVGVMRTHAWAPRVLIANSNLVGDWANWEEFRRLEELGLTMYGQMTAGSWIYIGSQGIVQGTYETFVEMGRQHYNGDLTGKWILTAGLGGMGGAQPLAVTMNDGVFSAWNGQRPFIEPPPAFFALIVCSPRSCGAPYPEPVCAVTCAAHDGPANAVKTIPAASAAMTQMRNQCTLRSSSRKFLTVETL